MDTELNRKLLLKLITNGGIVKAIGSLFGLRSYKLLLMTNGYDMYCMETIQCLPKWNLGTEFASHFSMIINEGKCK